MQKLVTLGQETINTQVYAQLDPNQCHIMTEHMQWYSLIGEAVPGGRPVKILRLAAFASNTPPSVDFSIRVYVVEDTHDALEVDRTTSCVIYFKKSVNASSVRKKISNFDIF